MKKKILVGVVMGSDSDLPIMQEAVDTLKEFKIPTETKILSAHRTPEDMAEYGRRTEERGVTLIIAGAGGAAHLPGMLAAYTITPVIGVPIPSKQLAGVDSLLSIAQMPPGIPVATVAIAGGRNAGLLAAQILALNDDKLKKALEDFRLRQSRESRAKNKKL